MPGHDARPLPWGIALSGGGVRSAAFSLGVLQAMREYEAAGHDGLLDGPAESRATFITSVSGGSYIAGALAMVTRGRFHGDVPGVAIVTPGPDPSTDIPAFAAGSPEETYLREHTRYLSHGFGGPVGAIWRLLLSIVLNVGLLSVLVTTVAFPIGWIYGARVPSLRHICPPSDACAPHSFSFPGWALEAVPISLAALGLVVGLTWVLGAFSKRDAQNGLLVVSLACVALAMAWLLAVVAVPIVLEWLRVSVGARPHHKPVATAAHSSAALGAVAGSGLFVSILTTLLGTRVARTVDAGWKAIPSASQKVLVTRAKQLVLRLRVPLINLVVALIGPVTIAAIALLALHLGSLYVPFTPAGGVVGPLVGLGAGLLILAVVWRFADLTSWSLHPFYRQRLAAAYSLMRIRVDDTWRRNEPWQPTKTRTPKGEWQAATRRPYDIRYSIEDAQPKDMPAFVICAAANVSTYGATPTGFRATSFIFSSETIGGPLAGECSAKEYERVLCEFPALRDTITFQAAVAMSGAAVSPEMGRMTRAPLRFLLTVANVRLGVWIPNPRRLPWFEERMDKRTKAKRVMPRVQHLFLEMLGKNKLGHKYLYVTDGGHYENLGLVEQLRRGSLYVLSVDASGEQQDGFGTIAGAVALAYSELNVRIDIVPEAMAPDPAVSAERAKAGLPPCVRSTFCVGNVYYPVGNPHHPNGAVGRLVVIKAGVPLDAPLDVADFHLRNPRFPCDPTLDQLYDAERFDAYKSLGNFAATQALAHVAKDFEAFRSVRKRLGQWNPVRGPLSPAPLYPKPTS